MEHNKTILVTGANGQLGSEIYFIAKNYPQYNFIFADRNILSIIDEAAIELFFDTHKIDFGINCAAYTAVDKAENEKENAILANATAVGFLAKACTKYQAKFIHISTDYVFDGNSTEPYKTDDATNPVNFYGSTKLQGEQIALQENDEMIIIRTSWVYSSVGNNFVKTMIRSMNERESIGVVNDQYGSPTYAADLAAAIMQIITSNKNHKGVYHYSNTGSISWYDFATEIAAQIKTNCIINPITTAQFPTPAKRPSYSVFDKEKITEDFGVEILDWKVSLGKMMEMMGR